MPEFNLRSIEPLMTVHLVLVNPKCTQAKKEKAMPYRLESHGPDKAMRCAVCEGKFGLVRHYSWRTPLCSRKCVDRFKAHRQSDHNWMDWFKIAFAPVVRKPRDGVTTLQISQQGKEYLKTAQTLLRTAKAMTDQAIAAQLKSLADDNERRSEKASLDGARHWSIRRSH